MKQKATVFGFALAVSILVLVLVVWSGGTWGYVPHASDSGDQSAQGTNPAAVEGHSVVKLSNTTAQVGAYKHAGRISRLYGEAFSFGANPEQSAESFLSTNARLLGVDASDLIGCYFQPIMYQRETGLYKFTGVYYTQSRDDIPVFGTRLILLVRNEPEYPLVLASVDLRNLSGFDPQIDSRALNPDRGVSNALRTSPSLTNFTQPELVIWAGVEGLMDEPTLAYSFEGDNGRPADGSEPERYLFVTQAETGAILYQENQIIFEDVTGTVQGKATQGRAADFCEEELPEPLYAQSSILCLDEVVLDVLDGVGDFCGIFIPL